MSNKEQLQENNELLQSIFDILGTNPSNTEIWDSINNHEHDATKITSGELDAERLPVVPLSKGGTGAATVKEAAQKLFAVPDAESPSVTTYPTKAGIYRTVGTNIFSNLPIASSLSHYGVLVIFAASTYSLHIYSDTYGRTVWGRGAYDGATNTINEPTSDKWKGCGLLGDFEYGTSLPTAGHKGRLYYKKV